MIKRLLVALDPEEDTLTATRYAAAIAQRYTARVTGLAIVDTQQISTEIGGGGIGTMYYAEKLRQHMSDEARQMARLLTETFDDSMDEQGVDHSERVEDGVPFQRIIEEMKYTDLLIVGRKTHFFYNRPNQETPTLARVVKRGVAPTLVVEMTHRPINRVMVAYDGSDPAARAMQRFAQLQPFGVDLVVDVVHVREDGSDGERALSHLLLHRATDYLRTFGFEKVTEVSLQGKEQGDLLTTYAANHAIDLVVAGAHSVSAVRKMAFGSTTDALLEGCALPLFLFH